MGHNLAETNGKVAMAYVGDVPWHGLGTGMAKPMNTVEALHEGGLNFEVVKDRIKSDVDGIYAPDNFMTIREDTKQCLGIVGNKYEIVQNRDAFGFFDAIVEKDEAIIHTVGALGRGERIWIMAKLPQDFVLNGEEIKNYLLLTSSHDGSSNIVARFTPVRVVCQNTLSIALRGKAQSEIKIRHTKSAEGKLKIAGDLMGIIRTQLVDTEEVYKALMQTEITNSVAISTINAVFPMRANLTRTALHTEKVDKVFQLFQTGMGNSGKTAWDLYNGITEYVDHESRVTNGKHRWETITFDGIKNATKQNALEECLALV